MSDSAAFTLSEFSFGCCRVFPSNLAGPPPSLLRNLKQTFAGPLTTFGMHEFSWRRARIGRITTHPRNYRLPRVVTWKQSGAAAEVSVSRRHLRNFESTLSRGGLSNFLQFDV